jgi:hypothetical protein
MSQSTPLQASSEVLSIPGLTVRERMILTLVAHAFLNREKEFAAVAKEAAGEGLGDESVSGILQVLSQLRSGPKSGNSLSDLLKKAMGSGGCCS